MRDEFLRLDGGIAGFVEFLNRYGTWNWYTKPRHRGKFVGHEPILEPEIVMLDEIWRSVPEKAFRLSERPLQEIVKQGLISMPEQWFASEYAICKFDRPRAAFPHFGISATDCFNILLTTVTIDHLVGTKHSICDRPDCRMPFPIQSEHQRRFCSQYCGHLESVRRQRRAEKEKKRKEHSHDLQAKRKFHL